MSVLLTDHAGKMLLKYRLFNMPGHIVWTVNHAVISHATEAKEDSIDGPQDHDDGRAILLGAISALLFCSLCGLTFGIIKLQSYLADQVGQGPSCVTTRLSLVGILNCK